MRKRIAVLIVFHFHLILFSQLPKDFSWPVDTTILITGNFGEIRLNHFHYGLDISIGGREGMKILAAADGYISRIKVGTGGYGKAIYISHPNGYTTVYGHLRKLRGKAGEHVKKKQYENQKFEFEYYPAKDEFPVKKGEIIGEGGNTGFSEGPHLHFEIRQTSTEKVINPYFFGLMTSDTVPPVLNSIAIEPIGDYSDVNGINATRRFNLVKKKGRLKVDVKDTIELRGAAGILLECWDLESRKNSKNGIYRLEMYVNGKLHYAHRLDSFSFPESRAVNAHVDYSIYKTEGKRYERCFTLKCDPLSVYDTLIDDGLIFPKKTKALEIRLIAYDFKQNKTGLTFYMNVSPPQVNTSLPDVPIYCDEEFSKTMNDYRLNFPPGVFYSDPAVAFIAQDRKVASGCITKSLHVFLPGIPAHEAFMLSMKYPDTLSLKKEKLTLVRFDAKGKKSYAGGVADNGWITESFRTFGTYAVSFDTLAPKIKMHTSLAKPLSRKKFISIKVSDNLSGIKEWKLIVDGKWYLSEYEPKTGLISFMPDDLSAGKHEGVIEVWDNCGNRREMRISFILN